MYKKLALALLLSFLLAGYAQAKDYIIGEGDTLNVSVWGEDQLQANPVVRPDGKLSMPGLDDVMAAGATMGQLKERITQKLSKLVKDPIVSVALLNSVNSRVFIVGGGVPARVYDMHQRTTLLHVLASLGDLDGADLKKAYVYREGKKIMSDFTGLFLDGEFNKDIEMDPGDTIFLPVKYDRNVFVLGAVERPTAIPFHEGLTALDAILQAGSFNKYADENNVTIIRKADGKQQVIPVKAKDLIKRGDLSQNIQLDAGDYLIVKESFF